MYGQLYDSMLLWYERWRVASAYRDFYALTSLTLMALLNLGSLVILGAHWSFAWAQWLLVEGKSRTAFAVLALGLLCAHGWYSRWRRRSHRSSAMCAASAWIAGAYMVVSVVTFIEVSTLAPL